jgi:hypothetical protein
MTFGRKGRRAKDTTVYGREMSVLRIERPSPEVECKATYGHMDSYNDKQRMDVRFIGGIDWLSYNP